MAASVDNYAKLPPENARKFIATDARALVETLNVKAGPLYSEAKIALLATGGKTLLTRAGVKDALALFREAGSEDTVILFLAGHGVNDGADYFFLPKDAEEADGGKRPRSAIKWQALRQVPAERAWTAAHARGHAPCGRCVQLQADRRRRGGRCCRLTAADSDTLA